MCVALRQNDFILPMLRELAESASSSAVSVFCYFLLAKESASGFSLSPISKPQILRDSQAAHVLKRCRCSLQIRTPVLLVDRLSSLVRSLLLLSSPSPSLSPSSTQKHDPPLDSHGQCRSSASGSSNSLLQDLRTGSIPPYL